MVAKNRSTVWVSTARLVALKRISNGLIRPSLDRLILCLEAVEAKAVREKRDPFDLLEEIVNQESEQHSPQ